MKKVLLLMGSSRKHGNCDRLSDEFLRGAREAGCQVEKIYLKEKNINHCLGCGACQKNGGHCVQQDDMIEIYEKWLTADVVALASPVYFYTWSSLMKTVIDRSFAIEQQVKNTKFYLISAGAAPSETYMTLMLESFRHYIGCFRADGNTEGGHVIGLGTNLPGDVENTPAMEQAFRLGLGI